MRFAEASSAVVDELVERLEEELPRQRRLEEAARVLVTLLQSRFAESVVLARMFATVPYEKLPPFNQAFVDELAGQRLHTRTPILSLLATQGRLPEWNDRRSSRGHVGIPLASPEFVNSIPMVSSLMKSLGVAVQAVEGADIATVKQAIGSAAGLFYVEDARSSTDAAGRRVIPAADFVQEHGVRSVFGFGGVYAGAGTFIATILFTNEVVAQRDAERFMRLANIFKATTMKLAFRGLIFDDAQAGMAASA